MPTRAIHALTYEDFGSPKEAGAYDVPGLGLISIDASDLALWGLVGYVGSAEVELNEGSGATGYVTRILG